MAIKFDGNAWATLEEKELKSRVSMLKENYNIVPKLVVIMVGDSKANKLYTRLKSEAAKRIGAKFVLRYFEDVEKAELIKVIEGYNNDKKIHGIMLQMPLTKSLQAYKDEIIDSIDPQKDVDGLRPDSPYLHPTSKAIIAVLEQSTNAKLDSKIALIGATGMVGTPLVNKLEQIGYKHIVKLNSKSKDIGKKLKEADVIISATGKAGLVKANMVKKGVIIIDVGFPKSDFERSVYKKASFYTPVPGGVGPLTIAMLMGNLVNAAGETV